VPHSSATPLAPSVESIIAAMRWLVTLLFLTAALAIHHETSPPAEAAPADDKRVAQDAANLEILKRLFGKLDDAEDESSQMHFDEEDDAFLGVVSKLLQAIEESEDGSVAKETLVQAARNEEFPHFEEFVGALVTEADEDGDKALNAMEKEEFVESFRMHLAYEVFRREGGETDAAVEKILEILAEGAGGGFTKQSLAEAAETHFHPRLSELVSEIFEDADKNADGVRRRMPPMLPRRQRARRKRQRPSEPREAFESASALKAVGSYDLSAAVSALGHCLASQSMFDVQ